MKDSRGATMHEHAPRMAVERLPCPSPAAERVSRRAAIAGLAVILASLTLAEAEPARPTVAVLYFDYEGKNPDLEPLRKGLAQMLTTDVADVETVRVVERERLEAVLAELALASSAKVDRAGAARVGKLLGAKLLVLGSFFELAGALRVDARIVDVETGRVVKSVGAQGKSDDLLACEGALADKLRSGLEAFAREQVGVRHRGTAREPSPAGAGVRTPSRAPQAKVNVSALAAYGRALDALDRRDRTGARSALEDAVRISPGFSAATGALATLAP